MSPATLYTKVEETIAAEIADGEYRPGDRLPSEDELLRRFGVSRITVRRAVQNLVLRGLLEIRRGRGTFVLEPRIEAELTKLSGFVEDMNAAGRKASARVLSHGVVPATARIAEHLHLGRGTRVMRIERVRLADGLPVSFDQTWLPLSLGKKIVRNDLRRHPIFTLLEKKYGVSLLEADYALEAVAASAVVAEALQVPAGTPIFQIERSSRTTNCEPIDYEILSYRGDLVRFVTRLFRRDEKRAAVHPSLFRKR
jgi:GntR family transcriptional regulator